MYQVRDLHGSTVVVTGANSVTGKEAAKRMAAAGAHVVLAVRSTAKGEAALAEIRAEHPDASMEVRPLDLASQASVRTFAQALLDENWRIDILANNAGVMAPPQRILTEDGFELQFATNFLGPFTLTTMLLPCLLRSPQARVATMSSGVARWGQIHFEDLNRARGYHPMRTYGQSKLADLLMGQHLATIAEQRGWALVSTVAHPGYTRTNLQSAGAALGGSGRENIITRLPLPSQLPEQGAEPLLFAATDPSARNGAYYGPTGRMGLVGEVGEAKLPASAQHPDLARSLWAVASELVGVQLP